MVRLNWQILALVLNCIKMRDFEKLWLEIIIIKKERQNFNSLIILFLKDSFQKYLLQYFFIKNLKISKIINAWTLILWFTRLFNLFYQTKICLSKSSKNPKQLLNNKVKKKINSLKPQLPLLHPYLLSRPLFPTTFFRLSLLKLCIFRYHFLSNSPC